jgi:hypothetical protein
MQAITLAALGAASKLFMGALSSTSVEGASIISSALDRPPGQVISQLHIFTICSEVPTIEAQRVFFRCTTHAVAGQPGRAHATCCMKDQENEA